jgi:hypothetical protein
MLKSFLLGALLLGTKGVFLFVGHSLVVFLEDERGLHGLGVDREEELGDGVCD